MFPPLQPLGLEGPTFPELTSEAITSALTDAGLPYSAIEAAVSTNCVTTIKDSELKLKIAHGIFSPSFPSRFLFLPLPFTPPSLLPHLLPLFLLSLSLSHSLSLFSSYLPRHFFPFDSTECWLCLWQLHKGPACPV